MTSPAPYLVTKYFPLLLLFQPRGDFPRCPPRGLSRVFQSWVRGRKAASSPSSLIAIKLDADGFCQDNSVQKAVLLLDPSLGEACAPLESENTNYRGVLLFLFTADSRF